MPLGCKRATTITVAIVGRAITIWEAIQITSHEPIYKTHTKIEAKILRAITKWGSIEKNSILKSTKNYFAF